MEPMNLRARKKLLVRDVIEHVALALFDQRGYEATTIEEIAAEVGISPRTFFRYFPSKEDVVFAHHADALARLRNVLDERLRGGSGVLAAVRAATVALQDDADQRELEQTRLRVIRVTPALTARRYALSVEYEAAIVAAITPSLADRRHPGRSLRRQRPQRGVRPDRAGRGEPLRPGGERRRHPVDGLCSPGLPSSRSARRSRPDRGALAGTRPEAIRQRPGRVREGTPPGSNRTVPRAQPRSLR